MSEVVGAVRDEPQPVDRHLVHRPERLCRFFGGAARVGHHDHVLGHGSRRLPVVRLLLRGVQLLEPVQPLAEAEALDLAVHLEARVGQPPPQERRLDELEVVDELGAGVDTPLADAADLAELDVAELAGLRLVREVHQLVALAVHLPDARRNEVRGLEGELGEDDVCVKQTGVVVAGDGLGVKVVDAAAGLLKRHVTLLREKVGVAPAWKLTRC